MSRILHPIVVLAAVLSISGQLRAATPIGIAAEGGEATRRGPALDEVDLTDLQTFSSFDPADRVLGRYCRLFTPTRHDDLDASSLQLGFFESKGTIRPLETTRRPDS
ncbi:MAG: hypothetical protein R3F54_11740 [Alphaproteobacteria bacterium]